MEQTYTIQLTQTQLQTIALALNQYITPLKSAYETVQSINEQLKPKADDQQSVPASSE